MRFLGKTGAAVLLVCAVNAQADVLRLGIGTSPGSSFPPYMTLAPDGRTYSGLAYDVLDEILKRTGDTVEPVYLPAPRLFAGVTQGTVDIDLFSNPRWRTSFSSDSVFTEPYLTTRPVVIYRSDLADPPRSVDDLRGKSVIGVEGFRYPGLDALVLRGVIEREDAPSTALVLKMIENHHGILGIADERVFEELRRRDGWHDLVEGFALSPPLDVSIRLPRRLAAVADRWSRALRAMKADGTLAALRSRYP